MKNSKGATLFLIVGNSGSGKDAIIQKVLKKWPNGSRSLKAANRYITRPAHPSEPFISITRDQFISLKSKGKFILTWHSYGCDYGIGKEILCWLSEGTQVLANVSRLMIPEIRKKFSKVKVIFIYVPLEITRARLKKRNREALKSDYFIKRLARAKDNQNCFDADFVVENIGPLEQSAQKLYNYIITVIHQKNS